MAGPTKSAKSGRNESKCNRYKLAQRQEINALKRLIRHAKRQGRATDGICSLSTMPKDVAEKYRKLNALLPNTLLAKIAQDMHVRLA